MDSSTLNLIPLYRGAEADLFLSQLPPWKVVVKKRVRKAYRQNELDADIRKERTTRESSAIRDAKLAGARTPSVLGIDIERSSIIMTFVEGTLARDILESMDSTHRLTLLEDLGRQLGHLHSAGIIHGDLTTSNIILSPDGKAFVVDFGMTTRSTEREDFGSDLHLLQRSLIATHGLNGASSMKRVAAGYRETMEKRVAEQSIRKAAEISRRGRYFAIR